jgi:hypothetical protein
MKELWKDSRLMCANVAFTACRSMAVYFNKLQQGCKTIPGPDLNFNALEALRKECGCWLPGAGKWEATTESVEVVWSKFSQPILDVNGDVLPAISYEASGVAH